MSRHHEKLKDRTSGAFNAERKKKHVQAIQEVERYTAESVPLSRREELEEAIGVVYPTFKKSIDAAHRRLYEPYLTQDEWDEILENWVYDMKRLVGMTYIAMRARRKRA